MGKESIEKLKNQPTKNTKAPAKIQFAEVFLKSLPELADSSSLTDTVFLNNLSDMYEDMPKDGKEIKERLGMAKSAEPSDNNLNKISDFELKNLVRETIDDIRQKPQHTKLQKPAEAQFADLFLKKVPTLLSSSDKTEKDLRDSLLDLHRKEPSNAAEIRMLLGLQAHPSTLKEPESTKTGPKAHKEKNHLNKGKQQKNLTASDVVESTDAGFLDIKLKPVKAAGEDLSGLTTVTVATSPDTKEDDSLLRTIEHFDDLTNMLEKMRRKPTVLEIFSKEKGSLKEIDKLIDRALSKAKLAVSNKLNSKREKKDDIGIFVDTFLKEIPENKVAKNIDKNNFTSKISQLPSLSSITSNEMRDLLLSVELPSGSEVSKHRYLELDNAKLEDTLKESIENLKNQPTKNTKAPAKIQFAEVFLKSLPELADSSSLTDTVFLNNLSD